LPANNGVNGYTDYMTWNATTPPVDMPYTARWIWIRIPPATFTTVQATGCNIICCSFAVLPDWLLVIVFRRARNAISRYCSLTEVGFNDFDRFADILRAAQRDCDELRLTLRTACCHFAHCFATCLTAHYRWLVGRCRSGVPRAVPPFTPYPTPPHTRLHPMPWPPPCLPLPGRTRCAFFRLHGKGVPLPPPRIAHYDAPWVWMTTVHARIAGRAFSPASTARLHARYRAPAFCRYRHLRPLP